MFKIVLYLFISINLFATQKIVTLSPAINEIVFALNKQNLIVGNTQYCTYPKESLNIKKVGGYFNPSLEKIVALKPDLVIMQQNYKLNKQLKQLGIKTKTLKIQTLKDIKNSILTIGKLTDAKQEAKKIVQNINKAISEIKNIVKDKKILMVIGQNTKLDRNIFVVGNNLYLNDIIKISQNKNAFNSKLNSQPVLNMENIIATNPDIVILLAPLLKEYNLTKQQILQPWKTLPINAVKNNHIYIIDKTYASIPSDRIVLFLKDFKKILYDVKNR